MEVSLELQWVFCDYTGFLPQPVQNRENAFQAFFIDRNGALCHGSGLNVDVVGKACVSMMIF